MSRDWRSVTTARNALVFVVAIEQRCYRLNSAWHNQAEGCYEATALLELAGISITYVFASVDAPLDARRSFGMAVRVVGC